jgi:dolichol kinase
MKTNRSNGFIFRKLIHIFLNGSIALFILEVDQSMIVPAAVLFFVAILIFEVIRLKSSASKYLNSTMDPVLKKKEKKRFTGVFWGAFATALVSPFATPISLSYAFAVFALADPLAALIGKYTGSQKLYKKKTIHGSTTFFVVASFVSVLYATFLSLPILSIVYLVAASLILTFVEVFSDPLDDNFTLVVFGTLLSRTIF